MPLSSVVVCLILLILVLPPLPQLIFNEKHMVVRALAGCTQPRGSSGDRMMDPL